MDRRTWATGLVASAGAFALVFFVVTVFCGAMERAPGGPAQCASAPHLLPAAFALVCVIGVWLAWRRMAWAVIGLGVLMTATSVLYMFSVGYFGLAPAAVVLVAGLLLLGDHAETEPADSAAT